MYPLIFMNKKNKEPSFINGISPIFLMAGILLDVNAAAALLEKAYDMVVLFGLLSFVMILIYYANQIPEVKKDEE